MSCPCVSVIAAAKPFGTSNSHLRRQSLFLDIHKLQGSVGEGCVIEPPFASDYGYNITKGQDVRIDINCIILDCVPAKTGGRCVVGHNVSILTMKAPIDPNKRNGSRVPRHGKPTVIEDGCNIGANATILPCLTVHRGSTVAGGRSLQKVLVKHTTVIRICQRLLPEVAAVSSVSRTKGGVWAARVLNDRKC